MGFALSCGEGDCGHGVLPPALCYPWCTRLLFEQDVLSIANPLTSVVSSFPRCFFLGVKDTNSFRNDPLGHFQPTPCCDSMTLQHFSSEHLRALCSPFPPGEASLVLLCRSRQQRAEVTLLLTKQSRRRTRNRFPETCVKSFSTESSPGNPAGCCVGRKREN